MKLSKYNYEVGYNGQHVVYNGLARTCVVLSTSELMDFHKMEMSDEDTEKMFQLGMYVDDDVDEVDVVLLRSRYVDQKLEQYYRIYTTMACNAKCPYCYERFLPISNMTEEEADKVIAFIKAHAHPHTMIHIEWFGGEPLLNARIISYITEKVRAFCTEQDFGFGSSMVTNGYLITPEIIQTMRNDWKTTFVQITLDGMKETYERIKGFFTPNAFERVLGNIQMLLDAGIYTQIRLNYDDENFSEIQELIAFLAERFGAPKNLNVYANRILEADKDNSRVASEDMDIAMLQTLERCGFIKNMLDVIYHRDNTCAAHLLNGYMIHPDGQVGKCSQGMASGDFVGDVENGVSRNKTARWCTSRLPEKCIACDMLPLCNGGCLYEKFLGKPFCFASKKVLEYKLLTYLQHYVDDGTTDTTE